MDVDMDGLYGGFCPRDMLSVILLERDIFELKS